MSGQQPISITIVTNLSKPDSATMIGMFYSVSLVNVLVMQRHDRNVYILVSEDAVKRIK